MYKVKICGAGSIGNHLANASRALGWSVDIVDVDPSALERTKNEIYPNRYGAWDEGIQLFSTNDAPERFYDFVLIGTPPDTHFEVAIKALDHNPSAVLIEKPACDLKLNLVSEYLEKAKASGVKSFIGYDHVVGKACVRFSELLKRQTIGEIETIDVEIREHWGGIFRAHPWLSGPEESYLGFYERGGGACAEHSHGLNLWQHSALEVGAGRISQVNASMRYEVENTATYDSLCCLNLTTENGCLGRLVQDVITFPPRKTARVQGKKGALEWYCNYRDGADAVLHFKKENLATEEMFPKTRPDDFVWELEHIANCVETNSHSSPISLERGLDTMLCIVAAHRSAIEKRPVSIDYNRGYDLSAIS